MVLMNILVAICACVVLALLIMLSEMDAIADWLRYLMYFIIVGLSVSSRLLKEARIIIVERDWIVEMCSKDEHQLAGTIMSVLIWENTLVLTHLYYIAPPPPFFF